MEPSTTRAWRQDIETYLEASSRRFALPGLALAIHLNDCDADLFETRPPRHGPALYKVGSLTKIVTALAVLLLQHDGALKLSDAISEYLPWFRFRPASPAGPITILDLLVHTSGLPRGDFLNTNPSGEEVRQSLETLDFPQNAAGKKRVQYSNLGYTLVGLIIEAAAGESYASFVKRRLFTPLKMQSSGFGVDCDRQAMTTPHQLSCFLSTNVSPYDLDELPLHSAPHASHDMFSTATDFCRLLSCLLNDGVLDGERILDRATVSTLMATRHPAAGRWSVGLGFNVWNASDGDVLFENAEHFGHSASMRFIPAKRLALVAMTNRGSAGLDLGNIVEAVMRYQRGDKRSEALNLEYRDSGDMVGDYESAHGSVLGIRLCEGRLRIAIDGEEEGLLVYKGNHCFLKPTGSCARYVIRLLRESGKVRGLYAGPWYYEKTPCTHDPHAVGRHSDIVGIYRNATVGRVALFERNRQLVLAYSPFKEAILEKTSSGPFVQKSGPFANERVVIDREERTLRLGRLTFVATGEQY